ncbi:CPBP family intramembrane glutamic endopeptidase [Kineococcus sp. SYSU DK003]|uniref:CPBP family intramembrane glutamic endopeptidase n=1 Tax=Kineococcus sp. SYSU DK003 TaxID=3383124 RepID=UPI003D7D5A82
MRLRPEPPREVVTDPRERRLLVWEVVAVFAVSLGMSGVRALVRFIGILTAPEAVNAQTSTVLGSYAPDRPWLDLSLQLVSIAAGLAPVLLVGYLLARGGQSLRTLGFDGRRPGRDVAVGLGLAAFIGGCGLVLYVGAVAAGVNTNVAASTLPDVWWAVPVQVLAAAENGILEEVLVAGYLLHRLAQLGVRWLPALVVSALLRGSYHLYQGLGGFVGNVAMGFVFGWVYQRWGRTMPLVIAHTAIDVVAFVGYAALVGKVSWLPG